MVIPPKMARMTTDQGNWPSTGTFSMPRRPHCRKLSGRSPRGVPPVHQDVQPSRISIIPSVVMKDGTASLVVITPLTSPTRAPMPMSRAMTDQVNEGSPSVSRAATITTRVTSAPTERSNSPERMTKSCPAARIIRGAARRRKIRNTLGFVKFGFSIVIQTSRPIRTMKIGAVPISARRVRLAGEPGDTGANAPP